MVKIMKLIAILLFVFCASGVNANEYVESSRYVEVDISPKMKDVDPLQVIIDFSFPQGIETVGEAIYLLISPSGYQLDIKENDIAYLLFEMPLPEIHKHLGPVRFNEALVILSGKGFTPNFDETLRLISFTTESESVKLADVTDSKKSWKTREAKAPPIFKRYSSSDNKTDYKVIEGDSISIIAGKLGLVFTDNFSEQLVSANPHAFINSDPNLLMSGTTIKVPSL
jgi:type IV pili sensor histidine kinase/response regulator